MTNTNRHDVERPAIAAYKTGDHIALDPQPWNGPYPALVVAVDTIQSGWQLTIEFLRTPNGPGRANIQLGFDGTAQLDGKLINLMFV
jgi:hypothetical protein